MTVFRRASGEVPAPADRFFGRRDELERILGWLGADDRLITLTGLAGMGKTRLAVALTGRWDGPVRWVDLADTRTAEALVVAVAAAVGVEPPDPDELLTALRAQPPSAPGAARPRGEVLLVLDGADDLLPDALLALSALVAGAPDLRVVCTSRGPLRLRGERRLALGPLAEADAVALLIDRGPAEGDGLVELVRDLDGMPLAIEIAAARLRHLPLPEVRRRLGQGLVADEADRPDRHRSLSAAIEASAALLSDRGRAALRRLTVFRGGFTLDAAAAVLGPEAVDLLGELVDATLVRLDARSREDDASGRYLLPGPVATAAGPGEVEDEVRHAEHFARLGALAEPLEAGNLEVAFERAVARGDLAVVGPLAMGLASALRRRGPVAGALAVLESAAVLAEAPWRTQIAIALGATLRDAGRFEASVEVLAPVAEARDPSPAVRAEALFQLGMTLGRAGRPVEAEAHLQRALAFARDADASGYSSGAPAGLIGRVVGALALAHADGDPARAREEYREALAVSRRVGDRACEGAVLSNLALLDRREGRLTEASAGLEAALAVHLALGHRRTEGRTRCMLGVIHAERGEIDAARALVSDALAVHREVGDRWYVGVATGLLGQIALAAGDLYAAREHLEQARALYRELRSEPAEASAVGNLGAVCHARGDLEGAQRAWEEALAVARRHGDQPQIGAWLGALARLDAPRAARTRLEEAEALLRAAGPRGELGVVLCLRAEVEAALGDPLSAQILLQEATEMAAAMAVGARSPLGAELERVGATIRGLQGPPAPGLQVAADGSWFTLGATTAELGRRHAIRRVLAALADARRAAPGACLDAARLFEAGWPGERAVPHAARERVYHAVGTLRRLGLGDVLERVEGGWRLDPGIPLDGG